MDPDGLRLGGLVTARQDRDTAGASPARARAIAVRARLLAARKVAVAALLVQKLHEILDTLSPPSNAATASDSVAYWQQRAIWAEREIDAQARVMTLLDTLVMRLETADR